MKRIRIHNDIALYWKILTNGEAESLEGRSLRLELRSSYCKHEIEFDVEGNVIKAFIAGDSQKVVGVYSLILQDTTDGVCRTIDECRAFELVPHSCMEGCKDENNLHTEVVELSGDIHTYQGDPQRIITHKLDEYLYAVKYDVLDYDFAKAYFRSHYMPVLAGCSVVRKGSQIGRNLDWYYNHEAEFIVESEAGLGRYASKGFAGTIPELTNTTVEAGLSGAVAKVLPFRMLDGINEKGVYASVNMLNNDAMRSLADAGTTPAIEEREEICSIMAVRYILDKFASAQEAAEYLRDYVRVYPPIADGVKHDVQIVVADKDHTFVLSFEGTQTIVISDEFHGVVTNFRLGGTALVGGKYAIDGSHIEDYGSGVERANLALTMLPTFTIADILRSLHYTHAYDENSTWLTEFAGINGATIHDAATLRDSQIAARALYLATDRDNADTWHTTHTIVYDLDNKMAWCYTQQDESEIGEFSVEAAQGPMGPQGPEGPQGPQGEKGENGEKGEPGASVTFFPAVTIFGQPHIEGTQISGFSADDYLQFPFVVNFAGRPWELHFDIATGADVSKQHNIFDSQFGLAFAFANGHFVMAMSSNGTSWDLGANEGTHAILPNQTYHIRMSWDGQTYKLAFATEPDEYTDDIVVASTASLYPRQIVIGKDIFTGSHFYNGSINFAHAQLTIAGVVVWEGMTEVGTATRMAIDMSNIDEEGINRLRHLSAPSKGETADYTVEMGKIYNLGTIDGATITLAQSGLITNEVPQWHFYFTAGANAPQWLVPITWKPALDLTAGTLYEVDIQQVDGTYYGRVDGFDA